MPALSPFFFFREFCMYLGQIKLYSSTLRWRRRGCAGDFELVRAWMRDF
jgi:hypothetical protein